jgi:hypothetical protein
MSLSINPQEREHQREWSISIQAFALLLFAIVGGAILRSAVATRLDSFHLQRIRPLREQRAFVTPLQD